MLSITSLFGFDDSPRINRTLLYKDLKVSDLQGITEKTQLAVMKNLP